MSFRFPPQNCDGRHGHDHAEVGWGFEFKGFTELKGAPLEGFCSEFKLASPLHVQGLVAEPM